MTKHEMVARIAQLTGVDQRQVQAVVQLTLDQIVDTIATQGRLELREFGVFEAERVLRHGDGRSRLRERVIKEAKRLGIDPAQAHRAWYRSC